ncbi:MAG: D-2-hydroxyacid dehydrogenase [Dehalococcoidia bacterium]|nr:D-2-hydroxyacid dehydrogenase [Dehalococcoidia bacterium]
MAVLLISQAIADRCTDDFRRIEAETGFGIEPLIVPAGDDEQVPEEQIDRIELSFFSLDMIGNVLGRRFFGATRRAPNLKWMQVGHAGTDAAVFGEVVKNGAQLSNASGSAAEPIAQTAIGGLLALARGFVPWGEAQRAREWRPLEAPQIPSDLSSQTMVVLGVGAIGSHIARLGQALGLHVVGVRRSPRVDGDPVDEMTTPDRLHEVLPRADWLALTVPLTEQTRGIIGVEALALLPAGAHILNVARGPVIDEGAMIEALRSGSLGGAYLDVFETEPLPEDSALWDLPNVIVSPHNSANSRGNAARSLAIFVRNLEHWARGEPLEQEVTAAKRET